MFVAFVRMSKARERERERERERPVYFLQRFMLHSGWGPAKFSQGVWWVSQHLPGGWELREFVAGTCVVVIRPTIACV